MIRPLHVHIYNMFINAYLLVYRISTKYSLVHGYGTQTQKLIYVLAYNNNNNNNNNNNFKIL